MKLNHKLVMVSAAVLMGVSPVLGMSANSASVQAAPVAHAKGVNNTYGKNSRVKLTKTMKFVDRYGKRTSKTAPKGGTYTIWNVKTIDGQVYYSIQTDLKYWIPASATEGTVTYKSGNKTYTLKSNGSKVTTTVSSNEKTTSSKNSKTTKSSKTSESTSKKSATIKPVKITMKNRAYVYDKNGKRVKDYLGTSYVGKGVTVKGLGTKTINGVKYYALQPNHYYVKASDVTVK